MVWMTKYDTTPSVGLRGRGGNWGDDDTPAIEFAQHPRTYSLNQVEQIRRTLSKFANLLWLDRRHCCATALSPGPSPKREGSQNCPGARPDGSRTSPLKGREPVSRQRFA